MRKQIALCIGNDDYQFPCLNKLKCASNDAIAVSEKLKMLNFDVITHTNLDRNSMHSVVDDFEVQLSDYDVALFYYAGHGFESNGDNLLMPIDTDCLDKSYRDWMALKLEYVISALEGKNKPNELKTKIIILDACRQHSDGRGDFGRGFAPIFAPRGTIIAFATSPGQYAIENGDHGAYTSALLKAIDMPRIPIENMFKHVRGILSASTSGRQISWEHTSLIGNYCFNEDRIDANTSYTQDALADKNYYFKTNNPIHKIVEGLKSYNWGIQNPAIDSILSLNFEDASANDLFVLGRNIYQAANGNSWTAQWFIRDFDRIEICNDAKIHILNGIAYEIYFNSYGQIRNTFKTNGYIEVLRLIEMEKYQSCKNFISDKLCQEENRIVYIPGSESKIEIHLNCEKHEETESGDLIFNVCSIFFQGHNILFTADGTSEIDDDSFMWSFAEPQSSLVVDLAKSLAAPPDMIVVTFEPEWKSNHCYKLPIQFSLRRNKILE